MEKPDILLVLKNRVERLAKKEEWTPFTDDVKRAVEEIERLRAVVDIETLRAYHDSSFFDPPSYHDELEHGQLLWDCPQCVERYMERSLKVVATIAPPTDSPV